MLFTSRDFVSLQRAGKLRTTAIFFMPVFSLPLFAVDSAAGHPNLFTPRNRKARSGEVWFVGWISS